MDPQCLDHHNPPPMEKQKWWGQDSGLADLQNKRVTVQGCPVKKPQMDYMSHRGGGVDRAPQNEGGGGSGKGLN